MFAEQLIAIAASLVYLFTASWQAWKLWDKQSLPKALLIILGSMAVILHGLALQHWIDVSTGQNLSLVNLLSLVAWLIAVLLLLYAVFQPLENLLLLLFPWTAITIWLVLLVPGHEIINTAAKPEQLLHILLSTLAFSVLCLAALQAMLFAWQDWHLRHRQASRIILLLPSLQTMEKLLFQLITAGFILLTIVIITSIILFKPSLSGYFLQKISLSLLAWLIFAVLLIGRHYMGWRSMTAVRWTLSGVTTIMLAYFGSELFWHLR